MLDAGGATEAAGVLEEGRNERADERLGNEGKDEWLSTERRGGHDKSILLSFLSKCHDSSRYQSNKPFSEF